MTTANHPATRMELLRVKEKKKLAQKGHSLLKKKRDSLIRTFFEMIQDYKVLKKETIADLGQAYENLHIAQGVSGVNRVKSLAFSSQESCTFDFSEKNLMGVKVFSVEVEQHDTEVNASLVAVSQYVETARQRFLSLLPKIVKLAEIETAIFKVAEEIVKTKRRVNALEYIKIPEILEVEKAIKSQLAEMERESFIRLKNVKQKLEQVE